MRFFHVACIVYTTVSLLDTKERGCCAYLVQKNILRRTFLPQNHILQRNLLKCNKLGMTTNEDGNESILSDPITDEKNVPQSEKNIPNEEKNVPNREYNIQILNAIEELKREDWNGLLDENSSPFLEYDWILALENSGCATEKEGWKALHIAVFETVKSESVNSVSYTDKTEKKKKDEKPSERGILMAVCPLYVKYNSMGEFIFDHSWADYAERALRISYYPKLLSAIPFTPATGSRLLFNKDLTEGEIFALSQGVANLMQQLVIENKLSSVHVNFMRKQEVSPYLTTGYQLRETIQYRWQNFNSETGAKYTDFDDYLSQFKSKRRMQIKRERRGVYEEEEMRVETIRGDSPLATSSLYNTMFHIYTTTVEKMWGTQYLSALFFQMLSEAPDDFRKNLLFIVAYNKENRIVGGTINLIKNTHFYGRYWGSFQFVKNLHFEACYYKAIEYCIENGISYMEPGAGGGEFKFLRGFNPYIVNSVHYFRDGDLGNAVQTFLIQERVRNQATADYLTATSPINQKISKTVLATKTDSGDKNNSFEKDE